MECYVVCIQKGESMTCTPAVTVFVIFRVMFRTNQIWNFFALSCSYLYNLRNPLIEWHRLIATSD